MDQHEGMIVSEPLINLAETFRREADLLGSWGATAQAAAAEHAASRIERALMTWRNEVLSVADAATESGYSEAHLRRLLAACRIENAGSRGRPRIRRADLPRKPRQRTGGEPDLVGDVLRARERCGS